MKSILNLKVKRLKEIKETISELYIEKQKIDKEIIELINGDKELLKDIDIDYEFLLDYTYDKRIDYEKLETLYPEIYVLGLETTFSKKVLLKSIDKATAEKIIRECNIYLVDRKIKLKRKKKKVGEQLNEQQL